VAKFLQVKMLIKYLALRYEVIGGPTDTFLVY